MALKNLKHVEEFNKQYYFEELNLLIKDLISNYKEMIFLTEAEETIKSLETSLTPQHCLNNNLTANTSEILTPKPLKSSVHDTLQKVKIPLNTFYDNLGNTYKLTKTQNVLLYENLLKEGIKLSHENKLLYDIIEKSIRHIYNKKNVNIEIELIQFLNIPIDVLTLLIMHELNNLIKYHPNTKNHTLYKTRFKLTALSYNIGNLFFKAIINNYKDPIIKQILTCKDDEVLNEYDILLEEFQQHKQLKSNLYFQEVFKLTIKDKPFEKKARKIKVINNLKKENNEFSYNTGQYFYNIIRILLLNSIKNTKNLHFIILKNKLIEYKIKLGSVFLHAFKCFDIFYENIVWVNNNKETILFVPNMHYFPNTISNIVHQRPYLSYGTVETLIAKYEKEKYDINSMEYYIYNICNTRHNLRIHKNPDISMKPTSKNAYKKLRMFSGKYYMDNFETLTSFVGTIDRIYYYNFLLMIKDFLDLKQKNNKFTFAENLDRFSNLFILYKIQKNSLLEAYETSNNTYKRLLEHLFEYALDFNLQDNKYLLKELKENLKPKDLKKDSYEWLQYLKSFTFIKDLYNKIYSYKIFLRGLLSECLIYTHFDYFIFDSFLDTRGRHYLNGFYLNPQSYPLIKAFVKPYILKKTMLTEEQFRNVKNSIFETPQIIESIEVYNLIEKDLSTYDHYLKKEEELKLAYIYSLFENTGLSLNVLVTDLQKLKQQYLSYTELFNMSLLYLKKYMTNIKKFFVLHSAILLYLKPQKGIINYYELDATASGLQMTAMVLRDATLGELCNLTPAIADSKTHNNDLYITFSRDSVFWFLKYFDAICNLNIPLNIRNICHKLFEYFHNRCCKFKKSEIIYLIKEIKTLLAEELNDKFNDILNLFRDFCWVVPSRYNKNNILVTSVLTKALYLKNKKHVIYETLYTYISIIGGFVHLNDIIYVNKENNWFFKWLNGRDVFKKAIMTFGYNATSYRRKEQFYKALLEQNKYKQTKTLRFLGKILNNLFLILKDNFLTSSQIIRDFGNLLSRSVKNYPHATSSILIDNGIFEIEIKSYNKKVSSIKVSGMLRNNIVWHELQIKSSLFLKKNIKYSNDTKRQTIIVKSYDTKTLARKFAPNFIHSMDAWLICSFKYKIALLNQVLGKELFINNITNHDTFGLTIAPFLRYFLMDIYKNLYFFDYIATLHHNYHYHDLLRLWQKKILLNKTIRKLNYRQEAHLGSPVTILYPLYVKSLGYNIDYDIGASTNLILHPYFVK